MHSQNQYHPGSLLAVPWESYAKFPFHLLESKFYSLKDQKNFGSAKSICNLIKKHHPYRLDGWFLLAELLYEQHGAERAVESLLSDEKRFQKSFEYMITIAGYYGMANQIDQFEDFKQKATVILERRSPNILDH